MFAPTMSYGDMERIARNGSPLLLQAIGRAFGLGPAERAALGRNGAGGIPTWSWVAIAIAAGFVAGARVQKRWPEKVPKLIQG
jgi:hypothetical protein